MRVLAGGDIDPLQAAIADILVRGEVGTDDEQDDMDDESEISDNGGDEQDGICIMHCSVWCKRRACHGTDACIVSVTSLAFVCYQAVSIEFSKAARVRRVWSW
jgi:hypothetical protein